MKLIPKSPRFEPQIDNLLDHIRSRTFGRLHDLNVIETDDGRIQISAIAHSKFVGQLAEWAVFERLAPQEVDLEILLRLPATPFTEIHS